MYGHRYRARSTILNMTLSSGSTTAFTFADATFLQNHDVLQLTDSATPGSSEYIQISGDPLTPTTATVVRGVAGTTPLTSATSGSTINLIGNSRTGSEVSQTGLYTVPYLTRNQYTQTYQFPVQVGGSAEAQRAAVLPGGLQSPFDFNKTMQLQNLVNDMEVTAFYGLVQAPVDNQNPLLATTAKSNGVINMMTTNNTTNPINKTAYTANDLIRDTLAASRKGGGEADLLFVGTDWMAAFAMWGMALMRLKAGETEYGTPIYVLKCPFLNDVTIIEAPLLLAGTAVAFTSSEVYCRYKRPIFWQPRAILGDRYDGDWIAEMAPELVNESHHACVQNVTGFSAN